MAVTPKSNVSRRRLLIVVSVILAVVVLVSVLFVYRSLVADNSDDGLIRVKSASELRDAINNAPVGVHVDIAFTADISLGPELTIPAGADVTLTSDSKTGFFSLVGWDGQSVIHVTNGAKLTLDGIIVTHEAGATGSGIAVGGILVMVDGKITGNSYPEGLGGVYVYTGGVFELVGGVISDNLAERGAGVYVDSGTFKMSGGEISANTAIGPGWNNGGGGVGMWKGYFEMTGGVITNNTAQRYGGGVYNMYGTIDRLGGEIYGNTAGEGNDIHELTE